MNTSSTQPYNDYNDTSDEDEYEPSSPSSQSFQQQIKQSPTVPKLMLSSNDKSATPNSVQIPTVLPSFRELQNSEKKKGIPSTMSPIKFSFGEQQSQNSSWTPPTDYQRPTECSDSLPSSTFDADSLDAKDAYGLTPVERFTLLEEIKNSCYNNSKMPTSSNTAYYITLYEKCKAENFPVEINNLFKNYSSKQVMHCLEILSFDN